MGRRARVLEMQVESAIDWGQRWDGALEVGKRDCQRWRLWRRNWNVQGELKGLAMEIGEGDGLGCGIGTLLFLACTRRLG